MSGYLNNPAATGEIFTRDGWLRTGDVVTYDTDGSFYVVDRIKELIKVKGHQVRSSMGSDWFGSDWFGSDWFGSDWFGV